MTCPAARTDNAARMDSEGVAQKRRVLVDALMMCLERSKVCEVVDGQTVRSVLDTGMKEMWREGELRLEYAWKILCQQPGLSAKEVAPPLLAFKAFEAELGVTVRVPEALTALPRSEQTKLRDELGITRQDFASAIASLQQLALTERQKEVARESVQRTAAMEQAARGEEGKPATQPLPLAVGQGGVSERTKRTLAIVLGCLALIALPAALFFTFNEKVQPVDMSDVAAHLKLTDARRVGESLVAHIDDPRWEGMSDADRQKAASQVFDVETRKGVRAMTLQDASGKVRVVGTDAGGVKTLTVK